MKYYRDTYKEKNLQMFIDICTYCNAGCPECHRTDIKSGGLGKVDWLPLVQWSVEEFKNAYDEDLIRAVKIWEICGTWGDPAMCKDLYEICQYILTVNPYTELTIDSNGSIRPISWWRKLGELSSLCKGSGLIRVDFALEGITQEMQEKYRRKTELNKILANIKAFTEGGGGAKGFCVVHRHNQDYLQDILDLGKSVGCETVDFVESNRFSTGPQFHFVNENGEDEYLEQVTDDYEKPKFVRGAQSDWKTRVKYNPLLKELQKQASEVKDEEDIY